MIDFPYKILVPQRPAHLVSRPRLTELLCAIVDRRLITISAPAGYGKTSLLLDFVHADLSLPICWYTLDRFDADPWVFLSYLAAAIDQRFPGATNHTRTLLAGRSHTSLADVVSTLARDIYAIGQNFVLIIDDWHLVDHVTEISESIAHLLLRCPNCRLILASRIYPSLPDMMLLAARRQMSGLDEDLLRFTPNEVAAVVQAECNALISPSQATSLVEQANGWITGILLSFQARGSSQAVPLGVVAERHVYRFLAEQVFDLQPAEIRSFLLDSALLDELTPARCDAILERSDSAQLLDTLLRNRIFISEIKSGVLRYHPLFRDFLLEHYRRIDPQRYRTISLRVAATYQQQQQWAQAFDICVAVGDLKAAQRVAAAGCEQLYNGGRLETLERWFAVLPLEELDAALIRYKSLLLLNRGQHHEAQILADLAEARMKPGEEPVVLQLQSQLARFAGRYEQSIELAQRMLAITQDDVQRGAALHLMATCKQRLGRIDQSIEDLQAALAIERQRGDLYAIAMLHHALGLSYEELGQFGLAESYFSQAEAYWSTIDNRGARAMSLNGKGVAQHLVGRYREAYTTLSAALRYARESAIPNYQSTVLVSLGDLYSDLQLWAQAENAYAEARQFGGTSFMMNYLHLAQVRLLLLQHRYEAAKRALDPTPDSTVRRHMGVVQVLRGTCAFGRGLYDQARTCAQEAIAILEQSRSTRDLAQAYLLQAQIIAAETPTDTIPLIDALEQAVKVAGQLSHDALLVAATLSLRDMLRRAEAAGWPKAAEWLQRHQDLLLAAKAIGSDDQRPLLIVRTLGVDQIILNDQPAEIGWQKAREVFYYLIAHPDGATPDALREAIWPDLPSERSRGTLKTAIYQLREKLPRDLIELHGRQIYRINPAIVQIDYDAGRFLEIVNNRAADQETLLNALDLYRGPYLVQSDNAWCVGLRADLEQRYIQALRIAALRYQQRGAYLDSIILYRRILAVDALDEAAYAGVMRCQLAMGNRAAAIDQYHTLRRLLDAELGLDPGQTSEVEQLYQQILMAS